MADGLHRRQRRHLRGGLGHAVGLDHRRAAPERLLEHLGRHRPAADEHRAQRQQVDPGLQQPRELRRHHRDQGHPVALERARDPVDVEAVVDDRGGPVDDAAHDDREPADVEQRQAAEPAVGRLDAEVEGGADRAPEMVPVGEPDRARGARGAAGQDAAVQVREVVLAEQRQIGLGHPEVGRAVHGQHRGRPGELGAHLGLGEPRVHRVGDRAELHQRVDEDDVLEPDRQHQRHGRPAPRAARRQAARRGGRLVLQLGVGERGSVGDQSAAIGAGLGAL